MTRTSKIALPLILDPSESANRGRAECLKCGLCQTEENVIIARKGGNDLYLRSPFMPAYVPERWTGKVLILAEAPGEDEDKKGRPMVGRAGRLLFEMLSEVGLTEDDMALTNASRCWPGPGNPTPSLSQVRLCRPFVAHDILRLRPQWVLALGDNALKSIYNSGTETLSRHRQRAYDASEFIGEEGRGIKVCFSYHPAACFYQKGAELKARIKEDLKWLVTFKGYIDGPEEATPQVNDYVGLDIEWSKEHSLLTVGQAVDDKAIATEEQETWKNWYEQWNISGLEPMVFGHSTFGDLAVMRMNGLPLPSTWISGEKARDTLLLARLQNENRGAYDLESLSVSICGIEPWKSKSDSLVGKGKKRADFSTLPFDIRVDRCRLDAWSCTKIASGIYPKLDEKIVNFTHRLASLLKRVEMAGVKINPERYQKLGSIILEHLEKRQRVLRDLAARYNVADLEPSNDDHFRALLYGPIGATPERFTEKEKEPSIDHDALVLLYQKGTDAVKEAVLARLRHEKADKLYSTYIGRPVDHEDGGCGLASHLTDGSFVFQNINPLGARTGRRSSDNPNMQNWPKRLRAMATSRYPRGVIVKGDESQLEPRIMAYVAGIDEWQDIFERGGNLYLHAAKRFWKKDVEKDAPGKPSPLYRMTKATILGTNYGMEAELFVEKMAVEQGLILTLEQGQYILDLYHGLYPQLPKFFALQKERLLRDQQVSTLTGQIRHLPCPEGERTKGFKHMWNQAVNFPIQGLAAFVTGSAALDLEAAILSHIGLPLAQHYDNLVRFWAKEKLKISLDKPGFHDILDTWGRDIDYPVLVNEVHDELVVDTPEKDVKWLKEVLTAAMEEVPTLRRLWPSTRSLRLKADILDGSSWGDG